MFKSYVTRFQLLITKKIKKLKSYVKIRFQCENFLQYKIVLKYDFFKV